MRPGFYRPHKAALRSGLICEGFGLAPADKGPTVNRLPGPFHTLRGIYLTGYGIIPELSEPFMDPDFDKEKRKRVLIRACFPEIIAPAVQGQRVQTVLCG